MSVRNRRSTGNCRFSRKRSLWTSEPIAKPPGVRPRSRAVRVEKHRAVCQNILISETKQYDFSLELSDIAFEYIKRHDISVRPLQPAVGRGSRYSAFECDVDIPCCPNVESMVVATLFTSECGHAVILPASAFPGERSG